MTRAINKNLPFIIGALFVAAIFTSPSAVAGGHGKDKKPGDIDASNGVVYVIDTVILPN